MAEDHSVHTDSHEHSDYDAQFADPTWEGGKSPMGASYGKLMMWYFLLSDAFTFSGFLIAYGALRFSSPSWPVPDFVFQSVPFISDEGAPLIFVTIMTFILIVSSVTMVRAVQEGHRENRRGVIWWMGLTVIGGMLFLGSQALEWTHLIHQGLSIKSNPFGTHVVDGKYLDGTEFKKGDPYLVQYLHGSHGGGHGDAHGGGHGDSHGTEHGESHSGDHGEHHSNDGHGENHSHEKGHEGGHEQHDGGDHGSEGKAGTYVDSEDGCFRFKKFTYKDPETGATKVGQESFGPLAFGGLFYGITGFHGFHVLSGVAFLLIILINVASGLYVKRRNKNEMVEKIGLYWHFVDLVWVFVFLVFYLL